MRCAGHRATFEMQICCECDAKKHDLKKEAEYVSKLVNELVLDPSKIVMEYFDEDIKNSLLFRELKFGPHLTDEILVHYL
jgi:hypothetical protein